MSGPWPAANARSSRAVSSAHPGVGASSSSSRIVTSVSLAFRRSTARVRLTARSGPLASARTAARMTTSRRGAPVANDPRPTTRTTTRAHAEAVLQNRETLRIQFTPPVRDVVRTAREVDPGPVYPTGAQGTRSPDHGRSQVPRHGHGDQREDEEIRRLIESPLQPRRQPLHLGNLRRVGLAAGSGDLPA